MSAVDNNSRGITIGAIVLGLGLATVAAVAIAHFGFHKIGGLPNIHQCFSTTMHKGLTGGAIALTTALTILEIVLIYKATREEEEVRRIDPEEVSGSSEAALLAREKAVQARQQAQEEMRLEKERSRMERAAATPERSAGFIHSANFLDAPEDEFSGVESTHNPLNPAGTLQDTNAAINAARASLALPHPAALPQPVLPGEAGHADGVDYNLTSMLLRPVTGADE